MDRIQIQLHTRKIFFIVRNLFYVIKMEMGLSGIYKVTEIEFRKPNRNKLITHTKITRPIHKYKH